MKRFISKNIPILSILLIGGIGVQTFTSCSSDDDNGSSGGGSFPSISSGEQFNPNITYGSLADSRDNKTYRTVAIGTQVWMAENLNYDIPDNDTDLCYNNEPSNCAIYGRLYDWATAMALDQSCNESECANQAVDKHRGVCPEEWHIPSDAEWNILEKYVDPNWVSSNMNNVAGTKLKAKIGWNWDLYLETYGNGTDDYGFSALPGGVIFPDGNNYGLSYAGYWWSATEEYEISGSLDSYKRSAGSNTSNLHGNRGSKTSLLSIRCVKDSN